YEQVLNGFKQMLGLHHPDTPAMVHSIASVCEHQNQYDKALVWYERAVAGRARKSSRPHHADTLHTTHAIANMFQSQAKYDNALAWYEQALAEG
ncbi:Tetratricopeptide repeat-domain-containing protein, partial [Kalaharituber pfeilii]